MVSCFYDNDVKMTSKRRFLSLIFVLKWITKGFVYYKLKKRDEKGKDYIIKKGSGKEKRKRGKQRYRKRRRKDEKRKRKREMQRKENRKNKREQNKKRFTKLIEKKSAL